MSHSINCCVYSWNMDLSFFLERTCRKAWRSLRAMKQSLLLYEKWSYLRRRTRDVYKKFWTHTFHNTTTIFFIMFLKRTCTSFCSLASLAIIWDHRFLHLIWKLMKLLRILKFPKDDFLDSRSWKILVKNLQHTWYLIMSCLNLHIKNINHLLVLFYIFDEWWSLTKI